MDFAPRTNEDNPEPRIACALLLDTSASMSTSGAIDLLNKGFEQFCSEIKQDELAAKRAEIAVITFGEMPRVEVPFTEGRDLQPRRFSAAGNTPMGGALDLALDQLEAQKQAYRAAGLEYYRPWMFVLSDGAPTDGAIFVAAAARARQAEAAKQVAVFPIGVGPQADLNKLGEISGQRTAVRLEATRFAQFFEWLSASLSVASQSGAYGARASDQIALPPAQGWQVV